MSSINTKKSSGVSCSGRGVPPLSDTSISTSSSVSSFGGLGGGVSRSKACSERTTMPERRLPPVSDADHSTSVATGFAVFCCTHDLVRLCFTLLDDCVNTDDEEAEEANEARRPEVRRCLSLLLRQSCWVALATPAVNPALSLACLEKPAGRSSSPPISSPSVSRSRTPMTSVGIRLRMRGGARHPR